MKIDIVTPRKKYYIMLHNIIIHKCILHILKIFFKVNNLSIMHNNKVFLILKTF
jgi:hypothetical protein